MAIPASYLLLETVLQLASSISQLSKESVSPGTFVPKKGARGTVVLQGPYWLARSRSLPSNLGQDKGWTVALAELKKENVSERDVDSNSIQLHGSVGCGRERKQS